MVLVDVAPQTIGTGLIATFTAIVSISVALIGLAYGQRLTWLKIVGMLISWHGVIFLLQGRNFKASSVNLLAMFGSTLSCLIDLVLQTTWLPFAPRPLGFASEMLCSGAVLLLLSLALGEKNSC